MELLTSSRLRTARDCARKHQLAYVERWRPIKEPEYFRVGSLVHRGLEAWWPVAADASIVDPISAALVAVSGLAIDEYEQSRVEELLRGYDARWLGSAADYEVLGVELEFRAPLLSPETWAPSKTWMLAGKIDAILRRHSDGRVLVCEHKTASEDVRDETCDYWARLAIDPQISAYVIGAEAKGYKVDEILYDVIVKPMQRPLLATPVEKRNFKKDGTLYANQRDSDETPDEYRARLRAIIEAQPDRWFVRRSIPRTQGQIADFLHDAWQQSAQLRESARLGRAPRNPDACNRYGTCPYWQVCSSGTHPRDFPTEYFQSDTAHPELTTETA